VDASFVSCREHLEARMPGNSTLHGRAVPDHYLLPPEEVIFGSTPALRAIRHQLEKVCSTNIPILIQGSGGSGKEILARWIHRRSPWGTGPFIKVNFAAIPGSLLESELFGYEAGAFTGANSSRIGRVEMAQGGTLFLDQITDLDPAFQAKILQLLQDGRFTRLGDREERRVAARIICANCQRLEEAVKAGHFRQDLYYRVNVFEVGLPRLSARKEDIPVIANYLLGQLNIRFNRDTPKLGESKLRLLQNFDWPGNIREMENWLSRYVLLGDEELSQEDAAGKLQASISKTQSEAGTIPLKRIVRQVGKAMSRELILGALQANRWNRKKAAKDLKISYRTLLYELRDVGLPSKRAQKQGGQSATSPSATPRTAD
jgi:two-component system response regulator AtoC